MERHDKGFDYNGYINIPKDSVHTFSTESDDGSRLYIGSTLVDKDGLHRAVLKRGVKALSIGFQASKVEYFQKIGGTALSVFKEGPGFKRRTIPDALLFHLRRRVEVLTASDN